MSSNGNGWKPSKAITITCPSGQEVQVRRPGPEFTIKAGRVSRTFTADRGAETKKRDDETAEQYYLRVITELSDEEIASLTAFARDFVPAMMVSPRLKLNPNPALDEIGPDDIPGSDFWFLFNYGMTNFMGIKVPIGNTEVEAQDLNSFREQSGVPGNSVDSLHIPVAEPEREVANQGLGNSAGA